MMNTLDEIKNVITQGLRENKRCVVAIAGPPGSGKSTLAEHLNNSLNQDGHISCVMPMDGFHLNNNVLIERGLLPRKGAPTTFDSYGFVNTVKRIYDHTHTVYVPVFDRSNDIAIAGTQEVSPMHTIVLVEGNYLLLQDDPWAQLAHYFDISLFINPGIDVIEQRILQRWQDAGLDEGTIQQRTYENDLPNAQYVIEHSILDNVTALTQWS